MTAARVSGGAGFGERVVVAVVLAIVAGGAASGLELLMPGRWSDVLIASMLSSLYALWILIRSPVRTGSLITGLSWLLATALLLLLALPLPIHLLILAAMIWLTRALYCYDRIVPALADALIAFCALVGGAVALAQTGSVMLAYWTAFLLLAVFVRPPARWRAPAMRNMRGAMGHPQRASGASDRFDQARRDAEQALEKLSEAGAV